MKIIELKQNISINIIYNFLLLFLNCLDICTYMIIYKIISNYIIYKHGKWNNYFNV